jgi:MinD superfamily P-loop ATPase
MASPIIRALKEHIADSRTAIIDSPPGTSCPVIASITGAEFCILVTEPTPFGLHDLILAVELAEDMQLPYGVIINRHGTGNDGVEDYCSENSIPVLMKIPYDMRIAQLYSEGTPFVLRMPHWKDRFQDTFRQLQALTGRF